MLDTKLEIPEQALFEIENNTPKTKKHIAKILLDLPQPHLDQLFEYEILPEQKEHAKKGTPVTVKFGSRNINGWIIDTTHTERYPEKLTQIQTINSKHQLLTPKIYELSKKIAYRYLANTSEIVKFALQPPQKTVDKTFKPTLTPINHEKIPVDTNPITQYPNGEKFLQYLKENKPVKGTLTLNSHYGTKNPNWIQTIITATLTTLKQGKQTIILLPDLKDCELVQKYLQQHLPPEIIEIISSEHTPKTRYTTFLKILKNQTQIIIGTQNAIFAPANNLGLIICYDDANLNYQVQKSPYINIRQVAIERSLLENN